MGLGLLFVAAASRRFQVVCTASAHLSHRIKFNFALIALVVCSLGASADAEGGAYDETKNIKLPTPWSAVIKPRP